MNFNQQQNVIGDVNCDDIQDSTDVLFILQYEVDLKTSVNSCEEFNPSINLNISDCDTNNDQVCDGADALLIAQCNVGIQNAFCNASTPPTFGKTVVANYRAEFQGGVPTGCWEYLWNANGEMGDDSNYQALLWDSTVRYDSDGVAGLPDNTHMTWGHLNATGGHPGASTANGAIVDRFAIAACQVDEAGTYILENSYINNISSGCGDDGEIRVYKNNELLLQRFYANGSGTIFDIELGELAVNDTIYVAAGPEDNDSCDDFEWDFTISRYGQALSSFNFIDLEFALPDTTYSSNSIVIQEDGLLTIDNTNFSISKNGVDSNLQSIPVVSGDLITLKTDTPLNTGLQISTDIYLNDLSTTWTLSTVAIDDITPISGTPSGYTAGNFSVNEVGAASYSIPIAISPGTAGMQPNLSFAYNSQGGNGLMGVGWSLSGLTNIVRCPATLAQDGFIDGVDFDSNDRYCLNGERLVAISGTYGANGTEYRTEHDTFSRIISHGQAGNGPEWFSIETKAGLTYEMGRTPNSRIEAHGRPDAYIWAVHQVKDTLGNYFTVFYQEESNHTEFRPDFIWYTGNVSQSLTPEAKIYFEYEDRPDVSTSYLGGSLIKSTKRLKRVESVYGPSNNELTVRSYDLAYEYATGTGRSRLVSITECGTDGSCFAPTTFDWQSLSDNFSFNGQGTGEWEGHNGFQPAFNGQWTGHLGGTFNNLLGDMNNDGRIDIMGYSSQNLWHGCLSTGIQFDCSGPFWAATNNNNGTFIGDFNGDGLDDFIKYADATPEQNDWRVHLNNGNETFTTLDPTWPAHNGGPTNNFVGDFNGDGRDDLLKYAEPANHGDGKWRVLVSTGSGFADAGTWSGHAGTQTNNVVADFDGDGFDDIARHKIIGFNLILEVCYSTGSSFSCKDHYDVAPLPSNFVVGNADGQLGSDVFSESGGGWRVCRSQPGRTFTCSVWSMSGQSISDAFTGDFTGDGLDDLLFYEGSGNWYVYKSNGQDAFELASA
ncbi:MAG: FG-GAP-like repeat-containing protein, partial [Chloroflexota bacterium]